ncbi:MULTISPECIES: hypothetical protein [unclassified Nonomuraea]|uniref:hypothetical protein n=1 Tax=unclassified Nonomuraea TaxID=2593643 RepID=UPI0033D31CBB
MLLLPAGATTWRCARLRARSPMVVERSRNGFEERASKWEALGVPAIEIKLIEPVTA